jgi:spoIIIJ-associated protein
MESENSVVVAAPSVDEAIIIGLTRLTATRDEVDIEVLDEGSRGFLGIGAREARVQVSRKPAEAARTRDEDRRPTPVSEPEPEADAVQQRAPADTPPAPAEAPPAPADVPPAPADAIQPQGVEASPEPQATDEITVAEEEPAPEVAPRTGAPETEAPQRPHRERPPGRRQGDRPARRSDDTRRAPREQRSGSQTLDRARLEPIAKAITSNLFPSMDIETSIEWVEEDRPTLWISLGGRDADALVGPRARNLHAAQYLIRALIYRQLDGDYNVVVDADGYRKRRRRSLETLAESKADRAVELGRTIRLRPMPAHERRIVHITLRQDERVTTESVGKGRDRAVTIVPKVQADRAA